MTYPGNPQGNPNEGYGYPDPNAPTGGVHVFFAPNDAATGEWTYVRIEDKFGMNSCVGVVLVVLE